MDIERIDIDSIKKRLEKERLRYWDIKLEKSENLAISAWNKEIKRISEGTGAGFAVNVLSKNGRGFSACSDENKINDAISDAVKAARIMDKEAEQTGLSDVKAVKEKIPINLKKDPRNVDLKDKKDLILGVAKKAYSYDKKIKSVIIGYMERAENRIFINRDSSIEEETFYVHVGGNITASSGNNIEEQTLRRGNLTGYKVVDNLEEDALEKCKTCISFLDAEKGKGGNFPVIMDGVLTDVFIHEALGHAAEADHLLQGATCLAGLLNKKIAPEFISVIDDPTDNDFSSWGSYHYDYEGVPAQKTYILQKGVLNTFLHNRETAHIFKAKPTGNARAQSVYFKPIIRMSNTYIEKGKDKAEEMMSGIKEGYLLKASKGGQVEPKKGSFQFAAGESYLIKNGKIEKPVKAMSIVGDTLKLLNNIQKVGDRYEEGFPGFCGKDGQEKPVNGRNPSVLVKSAMVS